MKTSAVIGIIALSVLIALGLQNFVLPQRGAGAPTAAKESTLERVMRTGTLRCGYAYYAPSLMKDPNTGAFSGYSYDLMNEIGKRLDLKIEWVEETGYGLIAESLASNRIDMFCAATAYDPHRAKRMNFSAPLFYVPIHVFVRADDKRFESDLATLDNAAFRVAVIDGDISDTLAKADFPKAQRVSLAQNVAHGQLFEELATGKADAIFSEPLLAARYQEHNPDAIRSLNPEHPARVTPIGFGLPHLDAGFKNMIDVTLQEIQNERFMPDLIAKYTGRPDTFMPVTPPYAHVQ